MIVCVCNRVSDRDIQRHVQAGCSSFGALQMETGVATCCGCCSTCAREVFEDAQEAQAASTRPHRQIAIQAVATA
ncbi:MAG: (2Fe-2S)-binding protein [Aquabacterium sp.]